MSTVYLCNDIMSDNNEMIAIKVFDNLIMSVNVTNI